MLVQRIGSLVNLLDMTENEVSVLATNANCNEMEVKRLTNGFKNLRKSYLGMYLANRLIILKEYHEIVDEARPLSGFFHTHAGFF